MNIKKLPPNWKEQNYISDCCGAFLDPWFEDTEICPECGEHCSLIQIDENGEVIE